MKYLKLLANWLFLVVGFLPMVGLVFMRTVIECLIASWKIFKEDAIYLAHIFRLNSFLDSRHLWLVSGELWPLQRASKEQKRAMRVRKTTRQAAKSHPSNNK